MIKIRRDFNELKAKHELFMERFELLSRKFYSMQADKNQKQDDQNHNQNVLNKVRRLEKIDKLLRKLEKIDKRLRKLEKPEAVTSQVFVLKILSKGYLS